MTGNVMRTFKLNKLVRDKIVESTIDHGGTVQYKTLTGKKLNDALVAKLVEETKELQNSNLSVEELADLEEIIEQLAANLGVSKYELAQIQKQKRQKRRF